MATRPTRSAQDGRTIAGWVLAGGAVATGLMSWCAAAILFGPLAVVLAISGTLVGVRSQPIRLTSILGGALGAIGLAAWLYLLSGE